MRPLINSGQHWELFHFCCPGVLPLSSIGDLPIFFHHKQPSKSIPLPDVSLCSSQEFQASILPVIVTNHTVTIAAELVSRVSSLALGHALIDVCLKEDGSRLVGQCEISHPIRRHTGPSITFDNEEDSDEIDTLTSEDGDDLDGTISKPQNVLFEATKKDEYDPLGSRIARELHIRPSTTDM